MRSLFRKETKQINNDMITNEQYQKDKDYIFEMINENKRRLFALENKPKFKTGDKVRYNEQIMCFHPENEMLKERFTIFGKPEIESCPGYYYKYSVLNSSDEIVKICERHLLSI